MAKPWKHAEASVRRHGGIPEDYIEIHNLMDSSKSVVADGRHRALTHNTWFLSTILERIFGTVIYNSENKPVSVRQIGEEHIAEDYGMRFIPTAWDFLEHLQFQPWMENGRGQAPKSTEGLPKPEKKPRPTGGAVIAEPPPEAQKPPFILPFPWPPKPPEDDGGTWVRPDRLPPTIVD